MANAESAGGAAQAPGRALVQVQVQVQVAYSPGPRQTDLSTLKLPAGSTVQQALDASGVLQRHGLSLAGEAVVVGIWGKAKPLDTPVRENDRIELWRGLKVDPKEARRQRYRKQAR